jgi:hypothetical protein
MIAGMLPMALAIGESRTAALGRGQIGETGRRHAGDVVRLAERVRL